MLSLAVSGEEIGRIYSVLALFSSLAASLIRLAWQKLYNVTLDTFPGAFLVVAAALLLITIPLHLVMKKVMKYFKKEENENTTKNLQ